MVVYKRNDGNKTEMCGVFGSGQAGTVCLSPNASGYASDFEDVTESIYEITTTAGLEATGLKGYSLAKAKEMLTKGATHCDVYTGDMDCSMPDYNGSCSINVNGIVACVDHYTDGATWTLYP